MTTIYLAWASSGHRSLVEHSIAHPRTLNVLVSFAVWSEWQRAEPISVDKFCLDSGAYSVFKRGAHIDLDRYIEVCKQHQSADVFGLDVVGDPSATKRNLMKMWSAGVPAMPVWRIGETWDHLRWCADHAPKIAFAKTGSAAFLAAHTWSTFDWMEEAMNRVWPKKVHGLGMASKKALERVPWHSVDASSWNLSPNGFGNWAGYTGSQVALRSTSRNTRIEIEEHLRRQRWAQQRWASSLAQV